MYQAIEEFQKRTQYGKNEEAPEPEITNDEEDDLRIMQHFARDLVDRSR